MTAIDSILDRIKSWASHHGRKARLSEVSGINRAHIARIGSPDWNPTVKTVRALDDAVTQLQAEEPVSSPS